MYKKTHRNLTALAALCLGAAAAQAQIANKLVVHLTFDGTDGSGNFTNAIANGIVGTPMGTPTQVPGLLGKAVNLTSDAGVFNYVTLGYPTELKFGAVSDGSATDYTIAFWCNYTNQSSDPTFIASQNWASSQNPGWGIYMQGGGNMRIVTKDDSGDNTHRTQTTVPNPAGLLRDGNWHHVAVTWERTGNMSVYKDGALVSAVSMALTTGFVDTDGLGGNINIGQDSTGGYVAKIVDLMMDDLGIWRRALSGGEIGAVYAAGLGGTNLAKVPTIANPYVTATSPLGGAAEVKPDTSFSTTITDGVNALANSTVKLTIDGVEVPVSISKVGVKTTVTYTPSGYWKPGTHATALVYGTGGANPVLATNNISFSTASFLTLKADQKVTPDTSKPGFLWNVFANQAVLDNTTDRTDAALAGLLKDEGGNAIPNLADPAAQGNAIAAGTSASANSAVRFEISGVINLDRAMTGLGSFKPDLQMPGLPATDGSTDGIAAEVVTYVTLPAGLVALGVNSDDGFHTITGPVPQDITASASAGEYNGARGATDSIFYLVVPEAGTYGFRTSYENGTGDANIEFFSVKADGTKVLINDTANGGYPAYRAVTTPTPPHVVYVTPAPVQHLTAAPYKSVTIVLADGTQALDDSSVALKIDGTAVTVSKSRSGSNLSLSYTPTGLQFPTDTHLAELSFKPVGGSQITTKWSFMNLLNIVLPTPVVTENFDSTAEGSVPSGWVEKNFTDCSGDFCNTPGLDLDNLNSDSYRGFIVVSRERLSTLKSRIFNVAPGQTKNGVEVTVDDLSTGNLLYGESDVRDGNQVQFITSKAFNLSSVANPALSFGSLYEQNQDSLGAVEYSVDGGTTWLPVLYFIDYADGGGDIKYRTDTAVDVNATLLGPNGDTASWVDAGVGKGGKYGDGIAAQINQSLGRFIAPRKNDDSTVDKRIEIARLPQAAHKSDVRLRFAQLGTGSWYFGIDNIAFYDVAAPATPKLNLTAGGGSVTISWTGVLTLQTATSVDGPWTAADSQSNPQTVPVGSGQTFWRLAAP